MPRYFFDVNDGSALHPDLDGEEIKDLKQAHKVAFRCLPEILPMRSADHAEHRNITVAVRDCAGTVVFTVCLSVHTTWVDEA